MFLAIAGTMKACGQDFQLIVDQYYADAKRYGLEVEQKEVVVVITSLDHATAEGRVDRMPDGTLRLIIDEQYWLWFDGTSQMQRLVYNLLTKALVDRWDATGVLNDANLYRRLTSRDVERMFSSIVAVN